MNEATDANPLINAVPPQWRSTVLIIVVASPYVSRALYALRNGGGIKGIVTSIWLGTNVPKQLTPPPLEKPPAEPASAQDPKKT